MTESNKLNIDFSNKTMADFRYYTKRSLFDKRTGGNGRAIVVVEKGSDTARIEYTCPKAKCGHQGLVEIPFKRPPFSFECQGCKKKVKIQKLKKAP